jgi:hypothetical protein
MSLRDSAIENFIKDLGREPDHDELIEIEQKILEEEYFEEYGKLPDAQQLQDFSILKHFGNQ